MSNKRKSDQISTAINDNNKSKSSNITQKTQSQSKSHVSKKPRQTPRQTPPPTLTSVLKQANNVIMRNNRQIENIVTTPTSQSSKSIQTPRPTLTTSQSSKSIQTSQPLTSVLKQANNVIKRNAQLIQKYQKQG